MTTEAPKTKDDRIEELEQTIEEKEKRISELESLVDAHSKKINALADRFEEVQSSITDPDDPARKKWGRDYYACLITNTNVGDRYPIQRLASILIDEDTAVENEETAAEKAKKIAKVGPFKPVTPGMVIRVGGGSDGE